MEEKEVTMRKINFILSCMLFFILAVCSYPGFCDESLTNDQKLIKVFEMYTEDKTNFPDVKDISPLEAMDKYNNGKVIFVDTRSWSERRISMLPEAVTEKEFLKDPSKYKDLMIIAYCTIGYRSGEFAVEMTEKGTTVYNLKGGILAWTLEGGKIYDKKGETLRVHVYKKKWNYAPEGYDAKMKWF